MSVDMWLPTWGLLGLNLIALLLLLGAELLGVLDRRPPAHAATLAEPRTETGEDDLAIEP